MDLEFGGFAWHHVCVIMAMGQYTEHDVIGHDVAVVVMVTGSRCVLAAVADWWTGVVSRW